ncbi:MAG: hypothetical protein GWN86_25990 [Desulfobacterales bacterium]|nr:hypothetical protein [Desulfobacterales bacterium]
MARETLSVAGTQEVDMYPLYEDGRIVLIGSDVLLPDLLKEIADAPTIEDVCQRHNIPSSKVRGLLKTIAYFLEE